VYQLNKVHTSCRNPRGQKQKVKSTQLTEGSNQASRGKSLKGTRAAMRSGKWRPFVYEISSQCYQEKKKGPTWFACKVWRKQFQLESRLRILGKEGKLSSKTAPLLRQSSRTETKLRPREGKTKSGKPVENFGKRATDSCKWIRRPLRYTQVHNCNQALRSKFE
jgi:hypothetical protein